MSKAKRPARPLRRSLLTAVLCTLPGCADSGTLTVPEAPEASIVLTQVAAGLSDPLYLTAIPGDPRLFVVEQTGTVRVIEGGQLLAGPFLDIRAKTQAGGERGLLSMAFHPDHAANSLFFVNYTDREGTTVVERYTAVPGGDRADPASALTVLTVDQPFGNHNGGQLQFGPDGMLYVGMGDGGNGGDPLGHGQNPNTLHGALLRLDVDGGVPYRVPPDNPYAAGGGRPEIWAIGLRNPWRFSFDVVTGDLYIADVGQNRLEEVNVMPASQGGVNYGWNAMEGSECFGGGACDPSRFTLPVLQYDHSLGCSVTGGYVYRGTRIESAAGHYFYADFCDGWIRSFRYRDGEATDAVVWDVPNAGSITSFGEDASGELYVMTSAGSVYRIDPAPATG